MPVASIAPRLNAEYRSSGTSHGRTSAESRPPFRASAVTMAIETTDPSPRTATRTCATSVGVKRLVITLLSNSRSCPVSAGVLTGVRQPDSLPCRKSFDGLGSFPAGLVEIDIGRNQRPQEQQRINHERHAVANGKVSDTG